MILSDADDEAPSITSRSEAILMANSLDIMQLQVNQLRNATTDRLLKCGDV
jgi:gamma-glutamyl phosphate reductase